MLSAIARDMIEFIGSVLSGYFGCLLFKTKDER